MAQKRPGKTVKVSVSLPAEDIAVLRKHAKKVYGGNLSAAMSEAARLLRQREARQRLIEMWGGPSLTPEAAAAIDAEQAGGPRYEPKRIKRRKTAA